MPRHPLSFQEKEKTYDEKWGYQVVVSYKKSPYVAINAVKKLSKDTAVVYAVGQKR